MDTAEVLSADLGGDFSRLHQQVLGLVQTSQQSALHSLTRREHFARVTPLQMLC